MAPLRTRVTETRSSFGATVSRTSSTAGAGKSLTNGCSLSGGGGGGGGGAPVASVTVTVPRIGVACSWQKNS